LRLQVEQATAELKRTRTERDKLAAISADVADTSDGALAVRQSMQLHREAMERLREAILTVEAFNRHLGLVEIQTDPLPSERWRLGSIFCR
jgi:hypothetical protein